MADALTTNYNWIMPQDHGSDSAWGVKLNGSLAAIDAQVWGNSHGHETGSYSSASVPATMSFYNGAAPSDQQLRWQWQMDTTPESGALAGSQLNLLAYDNTGALLSPPAMVLNRAAQSVTFNASATFSGSATFAQSLACGSLVITDATPAAINSAILFRATPAGGTSPLSVASLIVAPALSTGGNEGYVEFGTSACKIHLGGNIGNPSGGTIITAGGGLTVNGVATAGFTIDGSAYKPGGGSWAATSDARIKDVEGEYQQGLAAVTALRPVVYRYKGNDGFEPHKSDKTHIGLVAQEVEEIMPEMVAQRDGVIDNEFVSDLRTLDTTALVFALCNAVRELKAEIDELKARSG